MGTIRYSIWREYRFEAAHFLPNVPDDHKCKQLHGHTWHVRVSARKHPFFVNNDEDLGKEGWVIDFGTIDKVFEKEIMSKLDHKLINDTIVNPTSEMVAVWILTTLKNHFYYKDGESLDVFSCEVRENDDCGAVATYERDERGR